MNEILKTRLRENEEILWQGKPEGIELFEKPFPLRIGGAWAAAVFFVGFALWYAILYGPAKEISPTMLRNVGIFCVALGAYIAASPFLALRRMHNNVAYCITTERFIAYTPNKKTPRVQTREFSDFTEVTVERLSTGKFNLYIGQFTSALRGHARDGVLPVSEGQKMDPMVFASITDPQAACACLPEHFVVHGEMKSTSSNAA